MEARHTPGPWTYCPDEDDIPGHRERARVEFGRSKWVNIGPHGNDYDARLIAAAPDMLEALQAARIILAEHEPHPLPVLGKVLAAIIKATGRAS